MTLAMRNIQFHWNAPTTPLLEFENFSIEKGSKVLIRGASGSGKSTILNLIGGLILPQKGEIEILGKDLCKMSSSQRDQFRSDHMGFIFQIFNLIPYLDVVDNILLPLQFSKHKKEKIQNQQREEALRLIEALGLKSVLKKKVQNLSVGQQQRVAVARALIGSPELVLADEPSSALDANTREAFLKLLFEECEKSGASLLYVSHDPGLESYFDKTVLIEDFLANKGVPL